MRTVLLDRVVEWHKAEVVTTGAKGNGDGNGNGNGRGTSTRQAASKGGGGGGGGVGGSAEGAAVAAAEDAEQPEGVTSVWALLAKTGEGNAHKCLKKVGECSCLSVSIIISLFSLFWPFVLGYYLLE